MTRRLGIDFGAKRTGLSISDPAGTMAFPLATLPTGENLEPLLEAIVRIATEYEVGELIVGLPLNMDGTEGRQARRTRSFGAALAKRSGLKVAFWDERLSSRAADELLSGADLTRKKKRARIDRIAAQILLQGYLDSLSNSAP